MRVDIKIRMGREQKTLETRSRTGLDVDFGYLQYVSRLLTNRK